MARLLKSFTESLNDAARVKSGLASSKRELDDQDYRKNLNRSMAKFLKQQKVSIILISDSQAAEPLHQKILLANIEKISNWLKYNYQLEEMQSSNLPIECHFLYTQNAAVTDLAHRFPWLKLQRIHEDSFDNVIDFFRNCITKSFAEISVFVPIDLLLHPVDITLLANAVAIAAPRNRSFIAGFSNLRYAILKRREAKKYVFGIKTLANINQDVDGLTLVPPWHLLWRRSLAWLKVFYCYLSFWQDFQNRRRIELFNWYGSLSHLGFFAIHKGALVSRIRSLSFQQKKKYLSDLQRRLKLAKTGATISKRRFKRNTSLALKYLSEILWKISFLSGQPKAELLKRSALSRKIFISRKLETGQSSYALIFDALKRVKRDPQFLRSFSPRALLIPVLHFSLLIFLLFYWLTGKLQWPILFPLLLFIPYIFSWRTLPTFRFLGLGWLMALASLFHW